MGGKLCLAEWEKVLLDWVQGLYCVEIDSVHALVMGDGARGIYWN